MGRTEIINEEKYYSITWGEIICKFILNLTQKISFDNYLKQ